MKGSRPTLPQSLWLEELADAIFDFFLLSFSFSPASTTSLESLRQPGQYLRQRGQCVTNTAMQRANHRANYIYPTDQSSSSGMEVSGGFRQ